MTSLGTESHQHVLLKITQAWSTWKDELFLPRKDFPLRTEWASFDRKAIEAQSGVINVSRITQAWRDEGNLRFLMLLQGLFGVQISNTWNFPSYTRWPNYKYLEAASTSTATMFSTAKHIFCAKQPANQVKTASTSLLSRLQTAVTSIHTFFPQTKSLCHKNSSMLL